MEKMRMESENYVYKKEIDWSTLMEGFTLPLDNQVIFSEIWISIAALSPGSSVFAFIGI